MTNTELLIESIMEASRSSPWYEYFDNKLIAIRVAKNALKEKPDEEQISCFLAYIDTDNYFKESLLTSYKIGVKKLIQELIESKENDD